jgi:hypothetical protein
MATKNHTIQGTAQWAKVFENNRDMKGFEGAAIPYEGFYTIELILDKENREKFKASGSASKGSFDEDGNFKVRFKRKHKDRFEWASGAPKVTKPDGSIWSFADDGFIGNGSKVEVDFSVYTTTKSPGTRLEAVKVLEAVAFEPKETEEMEVPF